MAVEVNYYSLDCQNCNETLQKYRGCNGKPTNPYIFDGKELERCPIKLISPVTNWILESYWFFKKGFLPLSGSYLEQPAKLIEAWKIINKKERQLQLERGRYGRK